MTTMASSVSCVAVAIQVGICVFLFAHVSSENKASETDLLLPKNGFPRPLCSLLSPDMFSQADPFQFLLLKASKFRTIDITSLYHDNQGFLKYHKYPQRYIPYAKVLSSLLQCWPNLGEVKYSIESIRDLDSSTNGDISSLLADVSPSLESFNPAVFSFDILSDPSPPSRILNLLLSTPKDGIQSLKIQLHSLVEQMWKHKSRNVSPLVEYVWYTQSLRIFLKDESVLDNLKQDIVQFQSELTPVEDINAVQVDPESGSSAMLNIVDQ